MAWPWALLLFVRDVEADALGEFGKLRGQHQLRKPAESGRRPRRVIHATQHLEIAELVVVRVRGDGVAEVDADGFVDPAGALVACPPFNRCTASSFTGSGMSLGSSNCRPGREGAAPLPAARKY